MHPHYVTGKGPRQVGLLNQWSRAHRDVAISCLPECIDWPTPCQNDLTRKLCFPNVASAAPKMSQCHVYLNPFTTMALEEVEVVKEVEVVEVVEVVEDVKVGKLVEVVEEVDVVEVVEVVEVGKLVEVVELVKIDCEKSMKLETSPKVTKSKRNLHWCRSISNKNTCAFFITVSVKMLLHYRAGGLLQYRAFYYIIGQLLHYRAFFITLSGSNYSIGRYYIIGWYRARDVHASTVGPFLVVIDYVSHPYKTVDHICLYNSFSCCHTHVSSSYSFHHRIDFTSTIFKISSSHFQFDVRVCPK